MEREELFDPDMVLYVVDKRQELHFTQVFRCAKMAGIVPDETELRFLGFGTMNGKDGKPFKTRAGGVMRLETLIGEITQAVYDKVQENRTVDEQEAWEMSGKIALSALKYGDLSNQASKDYIFDVDPVSYTHLDVYKRQTIINRCVTDTRIIPRSGGYGIGIYDSSVYVHIYNTVIIRVHGFRKDR